MVIAIDFDGVLHNPYDRVKDKKMGRPIYGAPQAMMELKQKGHQLIIFTIWANTMIKRAVIIDWLDFFGIPFDGITNVKPDADVFIDDRAIHFDNWEDTLVLLDNVREIKLT